MLPLISRALASISGRERSGVEARLRGLLRRDLRAGPGFRLGRAVDIVGADRVTFGKGVTLFGNTYLNANGPSGSISIGDGTHVDQFCVLYGQGGLSIGRRCAIAAGVTIYSQTNQFGQTPELDVLDQPVIYAPVTIGNDVWIGARAVVLPGVTVGDHAVIGAGAVVRSDVAAWSVVGGVPARVLRDRRSTRARDAHGSNAG